MLGKLSLLSRRLEVTGRTFPTLLAKPLTILLNKGKQNLSFTALPFLYLYSNIEAR